MPKCLIRGLDWRRSNKTMDSALFKARAIAGGGAELAGSRKQVYNE